MIGELGAPERRRLRGRRPRQAQPGPEPVATGRATLVDTAALDSDGAAARWLAGADLEALADESLARLNRALHAHRLSVADPGAHEVRREQALVVRAGYGEGEQVSKGRWSRARSLPAAHGPGRRGGRPAMRAQERLAALLDGRDAPLVCEELALRARTDVDAGRDREAALQLRAAFDAALAELPAYADGHQLSERLDALAAARTGVDAAALAALVGGLDEVRAQELEQALRRLEAALRARGAQEG
ncbi:MAG TPA: hypothetical protein VGV40_04480 [Solirubrobacteraceae bacterium]|nr:hypothetical protein [Solirubrobacteraceae bacterium]